MEKVQEGLKAGDKNFKVHLDGYNLMPFFKGEVKESPRKEFLYWSDDGDLMAIRDDGVEGRRSRSRTHNGPRRVEERVHQPPRPEIYNLRTDPFERGARVDLEYGKWMADGCSSSCRRRPSRRSG